MYIRIIMPKKKVTLSIDSGIYDSFQRYCEKNAIMLSKRIEIFMKEQLEEWNNNGKRIQKKK